MRSSMSNDLKGCFGVSMLILLLFLFGASLHPVPSVSAQSSGSTVAGSYETMVLNQVTGPIISSATGALTCATANTACSIGNLGMGTHWLKFCIISGTVNNLQIELEGSDDKLNWMQISNQATTPTGTAGCAILEAAGYFQFLRVNVITLNGVSPVISAWYSGLGAAIPGAGMVAGNKTSQPVTLVPASNFSFTALKSANVQVIASTTTSIFAVSVYNPNGSPVFVWLLGMLDSTNCGGSGNVIYGVAANATRDIPLMPGSQSCSSGPSILCSTSATAQLDPATGCVVSVLYKPFVTVNTQINQAGTVTRTTPQNSN